LKKTKESPFLILCDINIPKMNGFSLKKAIDDDQELRGKTIPFVFLSTAADERTIDEAYMKTNVQGFFKKDTSLANMKITIATILSYWNLCKHPNS
jgi:CheY-like chemotaxis protein